MRLHYRITTLRRYLDGKRPVPNDTAPEHLRQELRDTLALRRLQPRSLPRTATYYTRYADDFVIVLCHASQQDAETVKRLVTDWLRANLGLTLNHDKTHITHWRETVHFLGYDLEGRANANGTGWLYLTVPRDAIRKVTEKIQQATRYPQAPEYDVFHNVNAVARGWSNYYRYAHNNNRIGGKLSTIIYWRTVHYLGKRQRRSIAKIMRDHYARDPRTGCLGLFIYKPGHAQTPEHRYFLWHKTLPRLPLNAHTTYQVQDHEAYLNTGWAQGRSEQKKWETRTKAGNRCEGCGATETQLYVHHPNRLARAKRVKKGSSHVAQSGLEQHTKLLCYTCHMAHHHHASP